MIKTIKYFFKSSFILTNLLYFINLNTFAKEYTVVLIPDTQNYLRNKDNLFHFKGQLDWILENKKENNIVFVSHVGDVISNNASYFPKSLLNLSFLCNKNNIEIFNNNSNTWQVAKKELSGLISNNDLPFYIAPGNHDYDCKNNKKYLKGFKSIFDRKKISQRKWFLAMDDKGINMAQVFEINNKKFLHIGLEWLPSNNAIEFAQKIILSNPEKPVLITTHEYLIDRGNEFPNRCKNSAIGCSWISQKDNNAEELFQKLIKPFPQVFMVLSGHNMVNKGFLTSKNILGNNVIQITSDFSSYLEGGNGLMTLIKFNTDKSLITLENFSPTYNRSLKKDPDRSTKLQQKKEINLDLVNLNNFLEENKIIHFRYGQNNSRSNYFYFRDLYFTENKFLKRIKSIFPFLKDSAIIGNLFGEKINHLKFDKIIGFEKGQVPPNSKIVNATLTLTSSKTNFSKDYKITSNGIIEFSNILKIYDLKSPLKIGRIIPNRKNKDSVENEHNHFLTKTGISKSTQSFNVTSNIQKWADGQENNGWILSSSASLWNFKSHKAKELIDRPMLTIVYKVNDKF